MNVRMSSAHTGGLLAGFLYWRREGGMAPCRWMMMISRSVLGTLWTSGLWKRIKLKTFSLLISASRDRYEGVGVKLCHRPFLPPHQNLLTKDVFKLSHYLKCVNMAYVAGSDKAFQWDPSQDIPLTPLCCAILCRTDMERSGAETRNVTFNGCPMCISSKSLLCSIRTTTHICFKNPWRSWNIYRAYL